MNIKSTKFIQTSFVVVTAFIALMNGMLDGAAYVTVTGVALANYAHHDVKQKEIR